MIQNIFLFSIMPISAFWLARRTKKAVRPEFVARTKLDGNP